MRFRTIIKEHKTLIKKPFPMAKLDAIDYVNDLRIIKIWLKHQIKEIDKQIKFIEKEVKI